MEIFVTGRERKMLDLLFSNRDDLTIKEIAQELDVSTRTVHRDLKGLEDVLCDFQLQLRKGTQGGLSIDGAPEDQKQLRFKLNQQKTFDYTPEERQVIILSRLLEARSPIKLIALGSELGVTVATISHDLDKIEDNLSEHDISLVRRWGYGVEIEGTESSIRQAISFLILRNMDEQHFFSLLRQNIQDRPQNAGNSISEQLLELVNKEKLTLIEQQVNETIQALPYQLADSAYIGLVVHLALAIERIQKDETIYMEEDQLARLKKTKEYTIAEQLIGDLSDAFHIEIPEAEIGYTSMHLMGSKARYSHDTMLEDSSMSIAFKTKQLISSVSKRLETNLNRSERLLNDLVIHLKPSIYRLQHGMVIENSLTDQMEEDFPELFRIVEQALVEVFPDYDFPREETAFVVMHFASSLLNMEDVKGLRVLVVCSSGVGTAKILAAKLTKQFNEIEQVDHRSLFDLPHLNLDHYDLIISTLALEGYKDYVQVSPVLPKKDIYKLQHAIRRIRVTSIVRQSPHKEEKKERVPEDLETLQQSILSNQRYGEAAGQLLDNLFVKRIGAATIEEALRQSTVTLVENGVLTDPDTVCHALLEREKLGGVGVPDTSLALYHTRNETVTSPVFTMFILEFPIYVQDMAGETMELHTLLLMLAPQSMHKEGFEILSFISSSIVEEEDFTEAIESKNEHQMIQTVSNRIYQYYKLKTKGE